MRKIMRVIGDKFKILITLVVILFLITTTGCLWEEKEKDQVKKPNDDDQPINKTVFEKKLEQINIKAVEWLDTLEVDPVELRYEIGIKGKKKFVELLDSYLILYQTEETEENRSLYKNKVDELTNVTYSEKYHDMNEINDTQFRQDSTSYLRAWYIMTQFDLNTTFYEQEIEKVIPRLDAHLPGRGINQKMVFVFYYERLGYPIKYAIEELFELSVIRSRKNMTKMDELDVYFITHEVFVLYDDNKMSILTEEDTYYLRLILPYHINKTISENNVDLLAELLMILTYLGFEDTEDYKVALEFLLNSQNPNGSFGDYEAGREYYKAKGIDIDVYLYLHTTEVSLRALNEAVDIFEP